MERYVLGILFDEKELNVLLTLKTHPAWQAGLWNGVGGQMEGLEMPMDTIHRECREEIGHPYDWEQFATMEGRSDWVMHCFAARERPDPLEVPDVNDKGEGLKWWTVQSVLECRPRIIPNLRWLVPMALQSSRDDWLLRIRSPR